MTTNHKDDTTLYDFNILTSNGESATLEAYKGRVLLIVNTASKCGFTPQFEGLQKLYEAYKDKGFEVLGFPSDQFANQEFQEQDDIISFCQLNYGVSFPVFAKLKVKGPQADPLFKYITQEKTGLLGSEIKWNFTKFLINREGKVVKRYAPITPPVRIEKDIAVLLTQDA